MKKLYCHPICPFSRQVRIYLAELGVDFTTIKEDYWSKRPEFLLINPAGTIPVLEESSGLIISGIYAITEYLAEKYPNFIFMDEDTAIKCETRRLLSWFNDKFYAEITKVLIDQKVIKLLSGTGSPRVDFLRIAKNNLNQHLKYISTILSKQDFLASEHIHCADIAAASHLSIIDYFGEIYWDEWYVVKNWYSVVKSRPSFQQLLQDRITGFAPASSYSNLDF